MTKPKKIISGGQEGADLGGVEGGRLLGIPTGGWIPKGGYNEGGRLSPEKIALYGFQEHVSTSYNGRTAANVMDADGTVVFGNTSSVGSRLTIKICKVHGKPCIANPTAEQLKVWVEANGIGILNVAGNRESRNPGIFQRVVDIVVEAFT